MNFLITVGEWQLQKVQQGLPIWRNIKERLWKIEREGKADKREIQQEKEKKNMKAEGRQKTSERKIRRAASKVHYQREDEKDTHLVRGSQCTRCYGATAIAPQTSASQVCLALVKVN